MTGSRMSRRIFLAGVGAVAAAAATAETILTAQGADALTGPSAVPAIPGPNSYSASWASIDQHPPSPEWFQDAKFGIYYHWGAFSVPAYGDEWYPRRMYIAGDSCNTHHKNVYGDPASWGYNDFIDGDTNEAGQYVQFTPKLASAGGGFDPDDWAKLFSAAGAKYAGPVAEHHDGFSMWNSTVNEWNSVGKGPHLDLLKLHADAIRGQGMKLLVAMHHAYHFTGYYDHVPAQPTATLRKLFAQQGPVAENQLWYDKLKEVIDQSRPDILWEDFNLSRVDENQRLNFLSYYYNQSVSWGKEVIATYKDGYDTKGEMYDYERGGPAGIVVPYWLTDDSISSSSWCYTNGIRYYSTAQILHSFIDRVSKNGNLLLNIAPMADGTIPQGQRDVLLGIGDYLKRFGESIYSTRAWTTFGEGPTKMGGGSSFTAPRAGTAADVRFTRSKDNTVLYATVLGWPGGSLTIASLGAGHVNLAGLKSVQLLGNSAGTYSLLQNHTQDATGLRVALPSTPPFTALAYVIKLTFAGPIGGATAVTAAPAAAGVAAYVDVNYSGVASAFAFGGYTSAQLDAAGVRSARISSLRIPAGYRVTGYSLDNFGGTTWSFTGDTADLRTSDNNDAIASLKVGFNPSTFFEITNVANGLALDSGGKVASGTPLKQYTWDGSQNLLWQAFDLGNGYYRLTNRSNGMSVDGNGLTANGTPVAQTPYTGGNNQQWSLADQGGGRYHVTNRGTGNVLDSGGQTASNSPAGQWTRNASKNTLWTFTAR